jgi:tetratricopeptide (TPR) repeat protein
MFLLSFLVMGTAELVPVDGIRKLLAEGNFQQCCHACGQQVECAGILNADPQLFLLSGQCSFHLKDFRESNRQLSRFITSRKTSIDDKTVACAFRARSRLKLGLFDGAIEDATQSGCTPLLDLATAIRDDLHMATFLQTKGGVGQALSLYRQVMRMATHAGRIHVQAAKCAADLQDRAEFLRLADRAMELSPEDEDLLEMRGRFFMCDGAIENAIASLSTCHNPNSKCGRLHLKLKEFQENYANRRLEKCQRIASDTCPENCGLSQIMIVAMISAMVSEGRSDAAVQILNGCIERDQTSVDLLLQRADLHLELHRVDEALADYRMVCRLAPDNHHAMDGIRQILAASDDSDLYQVLGVSKECTLAEVKAAYRREARQWHPDRFSDPAGKKEAEHRMKLVNRALEVFSDPMKKMLYDQGRDPDTGRYGDAHDAEKFVVMFNPFEQLLQSVQYQYAAYGVPFG